MVLRCCSVTSLSTLLAALPPLALIWRLALAKRTDFESFEYLPQNSQVYREHIDELGDYSGLRSPSMAKWICVAVIGIVCGLCSWLLRNLIAAVFKIRFKQYRALVDSWASDWAWSTGYR